MKRNVEFKDKDRNLCKIEIELENEKFSMSGETRGSMGQCYDSIKPKNEAQKELLSFWKRYHLNDMKAGTPEQEKALDSKKFQKIWEKAKKEGKSHYDIACDYLKKLNLYEVDHEGKKYRYGTAWLKEKLPYDLWNEVIKTCQKIESIEVQEMKLLEAKNWEDIEDDGTIALAKVLGITPQEALEDITYSGNDYNYAGTDYFVGTEDEAEEIVRTDLEDNSFWKEAVAAGRTTKSEEDRIQEVIDVDGLGHILHRYDGSEDWQEVNGTDYLVCRR